MKGNCSVEGCLKPVVSRGYCGMHRQRVAKYGEPGPAGSTLLRLEGRSPREMFDLLCGRVDDPTACWPWQGTIGSHGYGTLGGGNEKQCAHVLSWELHNGPVPDKLCVLHTCDFRPCVRPDHLFLGTHGRNSADMVEKDRQQRGERHVFAKLTDVDIAVIRTSAETSKALGARYGVHPTTIREARRRKTWKHLP